MLEARVKTYLNFVWSQGASAALLLKALLDAVNDLAHEITIVDTKELREFCCAFASRLERLFLRRNRRCGHDAELG